MKKEKELFFVGLSNPTSLRREILLSTKNAIQFLKKNEELKDSRIQKIEKIMEFKNDMKEINALMNRLKDKLPKAKVRVRESPIKKTIHRTGEKIKTKTRKVSELEKLETELGDIEKKLGRLR